MAKGYIPGFNKLEDLAFNKEGHTKVVLGIFDPRYFDLTDLTRTMDDLCLNKGCVGEFGCPYKPQYQDRGSFELRSLSIDIANVCASLRLFTISYGKESLIVIKGTVKFSEKLSDNIPLNIVFRPRVMTYPNGRSQLICFDLVPE